MKLHCYDLSRGSGRQLKWLLGEGLKEIWHTGVVAFDKEYFFSSDTIFDTPGEVFWPFRRLRGSFLRQNELRRAFSGGISLRKGLFMRCDPWDTPSGIKTSCTTSSLVS